MRLAIALAAVAYLASSLASEASSRSHFSSQSDYRAFKAWQQDRREGRTYSAGKTAATVIGARANQADPTGELKGYPDWARAAMGSGNRR